MALPRPQCVLGVGPLSPAHGLWVGLLGVASDTLRSGHRPLTEETCQSKSDFVCGGVCTVAQPPPPDHMTSQKPPKPSLGTGALTALHPLRWHMHTPWAPGAGGVRPGGVPSSRAPRHGPLMASWGQEWGALIPRGRDRAPPGCTRQSAPAARAAGRAPDANVGLRRGLEAECGNLGSSTHHQGTTRESGRSAGRGGRGILGEVASKLGLDVRLPVSRCGGRALRLRGAARARVWSWEGRACLGGRSSGLSLAPGNARGKSSTPYGDARGGREDPPPVTGGVRDSPDWPQPPPPLRWRQAGQRRRRPRADEKHLMNKYSLKGWCHTMNFSVAETAEDLF